MTLSKNQDRVGPQRSVSKNAVDKTGRSDGTTTSASGKTETGKSTNPVSRKGSEPGRELRRGFGPETGRGDRKDVPDATRIDDKISEV